MAADWNRRSVLKSWAISLTKRWNGNRRISSSVLFWYLLISLSATVPGRYLCGFLTPPVLGADLRAAFVANCLRGALPPVDLRAVCFVRAILFFFFLFSFNYSINFKSNNNKKNRIIIIDKIKKIKNLVINSRKTRIL